VKKILHYLDILRVNCNLYNIAVENKIRRHKNGKPYVYIHYWIPIYHRFDRGYNPIMIPINSRVTLDSSVEWAWKTIHAVSKFVEKQEIEEMIKYLLLGMYGHLSLVEVHHRRIWRYAKLLSRNSRLRKRIQWRIMRATGRIGANRQSFIEY